tara:strand:- start:154 stop:318 length:165 start_codon:yes stop_codon:yes gene_type:complete
MMTATLMSSSSFMGGSCAVVRITRSRLLLVTHAMYTLANLVAVAASPLAATTLR